MSADIKRYLALEKWISRRYYASAFDGGRDAAMRRHKASTLLALAQDRYLNPDKLRTLLPESSPGITLLKRLRVTGSLNVEYDINGFSDAVDGLLTLGLVYVSSRTGPRGCASYLLPTTAGDRIIAAL